MSETASQSAQILRYLESGKTLTAKKALTMFGCFRLAARIRDLRMMGHLINSERIQVKGGKTVARYSMP
jgi:hypothetical protein